MLKFLSIIKLIVILSIILINYRVYSDSSILIPPTPMYLGARPLGMGDAFVAVADDENTIFQNPAGIGLNNLKSKSILKSASFPNISFSSNAYTTDLLGNYFNSFEYPSGIINKAVTNSDTNNIVFTRLSLFPNVVIGRFQLGILVDSYVNGYTTKSNSIQTSAYSTSASPLTYDRTFTLFSRDQYGPVMGFSYTFSRHIVLGLGSRFMQRATKMNTIEANQNGAIDASNKASDKNVNYTYGFAFDTGIILPLYDSINTKIAFSFLDVGDTTYKAASSSSSNEVEKMNIKGGLSISPDISKNVGTILSIEEERINDPRVDDRNKLRAGCEFSFGEKTGANAPFSARLGYGMQTFSAGMSIYILFANLEFATYGESVPINNGYVIDRRYITKLTVDILN
ncbi:hypothetical protein GCL60_08255 [Silvanigrella paludirubra]|uniref:Type IX secretion system outer membrane channel protein PorV n=1 Tax=Silvanigrella paludirubra TaxID=2499159 RepID=A0A6N6VRU7_9BACT|nr:hypothetical protein [Silvanigrella paludirubra]KAB8038842.1 hypothetical protein GCL60_08255 [Silvanigrella paludirubra]